MPLVSVLMPVLNRETLVEEAIRSIRNQTLEDWELVILDDGSTDRSLEVCRSYEAQDKRIRVYANEVNLGVGETRSRLVSYARGEYIAHLDSDDVSLPERLALEVALLNARPEIGLVCAVTALLDDVGQVFSYAPETFNLYGGEQYPQNNGEMIKLMYLTNCISSPTCMYRRSLIEQIPNPYGKHRFHEDWFFLLHVAHCARIWGIPRVLVRTRSGQNHVHLYRFAGAILGEVCRFKREVYLHYKNVPGSPIRYSLYRKSMAKSLTGYGRYEGSWKGYFHILQAVFHDPGNKHARKSLWEFSGRALRKAKRLALG